MVFTDAYTLEPTRVIEVAEDLVSEFDFVSVDQNLVQEVIEKTEVRQVKREEVWRRTVSSVFMV